MAIRYCGRSLLPDGLTVDRIEEVGGTVMAVARSLPPTSSCPVCGQGSSHLHSRYQRCLSDLPAHGRQVRIQFHVRRFRCRGADCPRRIFAKRLDAGIVQPWARRSVRLQELVLYVARMLGGCPGQSLTQRLLLPVSNDTLLRGQDQIEIVACDRGGGYSRSGRSCAGRATAAGWSAGCYAASAPMSSASGRARLSFICLGSRNNGPRANGMARHFGASQGFRGSLRVVTEWVTRRCRAEQTDYGLTRTPSSRTIARLMTIGRDRLSKAETVTVATIETGVPPLVEAREIIVAL